MKISDRPYNGIYNTDESKVPPCEIPSPLKTADGGTIRNAFEWMNFRRPELLNLFRDEEVEESQRGKLAVFHRQRAELIGTPSTALRYAGKS